MSNQLEKTETKNMPYGLLISAAYNSQKMAAVLKFYDPTSQRIFLWADKSGHKPYCYSKLSPDEIPTEISERDDVIEIKQVKLLDILNDKPIDVSKIIVKDPLAIGGTQTNKSIRNLIDTWESDIKYYESYLYDNSLIVGKYYKIENDTIIPYDLEISDETQLSLKNMLLDKQSDTNLPDTKQFDEHVAQWANLLNQPIPKIKRVSMDIEVESEVSRIPDPKTAEKKITAVGFEGSDGLKQVFILRRSGIEEGVNELLSGVKIIFYDETKEREMILDTFELIEKYPLLITYNGDGFDLPYLYNRANRLGIDRQKNPLYMMRDSATLTVGVHLDLYRTMSNRAFQIYAFGQKYSDFSLNSVAKGLLGEKKIDYGVELGNLTLYQTANYCQNDARITYNLTSFNNDLLMNLLIVISRIARMPIDDISRMGVSQWIRSLLYYEHRQNGILIPRRQELDNRSSDVSNDAIIKDKKFRGGLVVEPQVGIHFDVTVMDFASLYPSIIKVKNLSYETVRCSHDECKKNTIPQTNHWVCTKKNGLTAVLIGSLRDLRVNYYKNMAKKDTLTAEERQLFTVVSQALKVILNASYGVMGAEIFPLYFLPAAEATTATGRHIILSTINKCKESGIDVLYGDTDSLFLKKPTPKQIEDIITSAKIDHNVELEIDKEYRYVVLSSRKKNYLGVTKNGKVDVKGLTGKKSHTPPFIKTLFYEILDILSEIKTVEEFESAKNKISDKIAQCARKVQAKEIPLQDLVFNVMLSKAPKDYTKTVPQHIRAAKQLESIREIKKGDIISYVKIVNKPGVKPIEMARKSEIDSSKYMEFMESMLDQITSSMDLDFDTILGKPKQTGLEQFFWN
ncbi:DNA-directed DNA polymerase I [Marine Group I thaumarchaeote]|uniref:DNA polymerase n=1 Tax=Marine Group I thaumarchaeote TaxID=2511932 RepID=A0A7K4N2T2_9ARCH|nr:DNA-directed DNA polymerase I [Marine Group I thaumarchaeote]